MAGCARGVNECSPPLIETYRVQTNAWISVAFYPTQTKSGVNIVEWSMLYVNVLDFRYVFALSNYGANCLRLGTKNGANFGFFGPRSF